MGFHMFQHGYKLPQHLLLNVNVQWVFFRPSWAAAAMARLLHDAPVQKEPHWRTPTPWHWHSCTITILWSLISPLVCAAMSEYGKLQPNAPLCCLSSHVTPHFSFTHTSLHMWASDHDHIHHRSPAECLCEYKNTICKLKLPLKAWHVNSTQSES